MPRRSKVTPKLTCIFIDACLIVIIIIIIFTSVGTTCTHFSFQCKLQRLGDRHPKLHRKRSKMHPTQQHLIRKAHSFCLVSKEIGNCCLPGSTAHGHHKVTCWHDELCKGLGPSNSLPNLKRCCASRCQSTCSWNPVSARKTDMCGRFVSSGNSRPRHFGWLNECMAWH